MHSHKWDARRNRQRPQRNMYNNSWNRPKHFFNPLRLYQCSQGKVSGVKTKTPRWQPRGVRHAIFPAVSPGSIGVFRARLLVRRLRVNSFLFRLVLFG